MYKKKLTEFFSFQITTEGKVLGGQSDSFESRVSIELVEPAIAANFRGVDVGISVTTSKRVL